MTRIARRVQIRWLLLIPVIFVFVALSLHSISLSGWFPGLHDGKGFWYFATDAIGDHATSVMLADMLRRGDFPDWWRIFPPGAYGSYLTYIKIHSLFYYFLGDSPMSLLPWSVFLYTVAVLMAFSVGRTLFNEKTAFWTAIVVGLFPSFLIYSTQSGKDVFYIVGQLFLLNAMVAWTERDLNAKRVAFIILTSALGFGMMRLIRPYMVQVMVVFWVGALGIGLYEGFRRKRKMTGILSVCIVALVAFGAVSRLDRYGWTFFFWDWLRGKNLLRVEDPKGDVARCIARNEGNDGYCLAGCEDRNNGATPFCWLMMIEHTRWKFRKTSPTGGSNIDQDVMLRSPGDILRYAPRALQIGLTAPFPGGWLTAGKTSGRWGALLAGLETGLMYIATLLAAVCVWMERRKPGVWLIAVLVICGLTLLGLVVVNLGALYRHRYIFWFMIVLLAVQGAFRLRGGGGRKAAGTEVRE